MKQHEELNEDLELDNVEYEDWEFEHTNNVVDQFLNEYLVPDLEKFDFQNNDENYIPGVACFTLFTMLIDILTQNGWTPEELKSTVDDFSNQSSFEVIH